jgi:hypothetical protein
MSMRSSPTPCSIDGCKNLAKYSATGWCQTHYHRYWRTGSTADPVVGDEIEVSTTYRSCHMRNISKWGPASLYPCVECGEQAREYAYDGTDPDELRGLTEVNGVDYPISWSRWPEFYMPMCFSCHRRKDARSRSDRRTRCGNGHELTEENVYVRPGGHGRECRACKRDEYRRRRIAQGHPDPGPESPKGSTGVKNVTRKGSGYRAAVRRNGETLRGPTRRSIEAAIVDRDQFIRQLERVAPIHHAGERKKE